MSDIPEPVNPSSDKHYPDHLMKDLPNYKPFISPCSCQHWENILLHMEDIMWCM